MTGPQAVRRFLGHMAAGEWDAMAACVAEDVVRAGPFGDVKAGRDDYRAFLAETIEAIDGYRMDVTRVWGDDRLVTAELSETMDVDGRPRRTDESLVFDLGDDGLITRVAVYLQTGQFIDEPRPER